MDGLYNFFLFRYRNHDYVEISQARLTLNFCLITSFFSLLYVFIANLIDFQESVLVMSSLAILFLILALLIRYAIPLFVIAFLILSISFGAAIYLVSLSGGIYSSILPWLSFIPLIAILLQNRNAAFVWLFICFVTVFVFAFIQDGYSDVPVKYNKDYDVWFFAGVYNGLSAIILALSMVFQKAKDNVLKTLEEKNQLISSINLELMNKNDEIIAQNKELSKQKEEILAQREFIEIKNRELLLIQDELNGLIDKLTITQSNLAGREAENRSILNSIYGAQLIVGELDLDGCFKKVSPEAVKFLQIQEEDLIGKSFAEVGQRVKMSISNNVLFDEMWEDLLEGKSSSHEALLIINENEYYVKENYFPILGEDGKPVKVMIIAQDISQIKNQQNEIEVLNLDLQENIWKIEKQNDQLIVQQKEIESIFEELQKSNEAIKNINLTLEKRVQERTKNLELQNKQLSEYGFINAHLLRGPLCSILGLIQLLENDETIDKENLILFHLKKSSGELKEVVDKISKALEKGTHFDRKLIHKN